ncbi:MAG: amino acid adenylation domain-containing protein [Scytonematopsis contorta HA4267-MV1]|jgi:amino acid adenylation domain-containing protein|nr:amino acid adenylation domain-containing protein [Scytonematopsis contorta HA4267-MV1]
MNLAEFLEDLSQQNIELWIEGDRLRYRGPVEALNPMLLNKIKQHKAEILQLLQKEFHTSKYYPLTYGQQGLWFLYKLTPHSAAYNLAFTARIRSDLNVQALQRAVQTLIVRHPTLRTTFGQRGVEFFQEVHECQKICLEQTDASAWNEDELTRRAIDAYRQPFNLEQEPPIRANLFTRSAQDHVFLLTIHHIAVDGFSFGILLDELRLLYDSEQTGRTVSLSPIKWQYQDFVHWQREFLSSPVRDNLQNYWQKQLAGELPVLNLPTDRPRPAIQNYQGASHTFELSKELTKSLREMAKAEGATLYMTLLTAFVVLLYRYTGQEDIIVGSPTEGRSQPEFDTVVGFFVNMLALRVNIVDNPTFSALLSQVRSTVLGALAHQDYPSSLLIERLHLNRDPSLPGLFPVSFNLLKLQAMAPDYELSVLPSSKARENWGGLLLEPFVIPQQEGQNDIVLDVIESTESLFGIFKYSTDLFDASTISRMAVNFQTLLEGIVANKGQQISSLPLLNQAEQDYLLLESNNRQVNYPQGECIHQLFEKSVKNTPNAIAVEYQGQQLTYQELNVRANQLAHHLIHLGVRPEVLVGICVERSLEMIVGLLGILKAGGAYVPLDPAYPQERLADMLNDSQASVLLTQESLRDRFGEYSGCIVNLDRQWQAISQECKENLSVDVQAQNLAYIIYTSGSTGKPKGVMICHRSLVNAYYGWEQAYQLRSHTSSHLQMASFCFDVFSGDMVRSLCSGGKLVLCPKELLLMPEQLYELMQKQKVDCGEFVPVVIRNLMAYLEKTGQNLDFLKVLIVGSDSWYVEEYQQLRRLCGENTRVINSYGVSEATIDSCYFESTTFKLPSDALVPIGRPFGNVEIYILDANHELVPIGVPGELYIGGDGLALGYLNRPQLTSEKYITNPFERKSKLYKAGDLARYLPDGNIEFLGRIDNQVKIRGFRIELGEIEAVLNTHPQIEQAVVITREDVSGNKRLVAYVVSNYELLSTNQLRELLKQKLPEYMVPSAFVTLDTLPLTANGKIDRRALPAPDIENGFALQFVAPRTPTEEVIANICAEVLGLKLVGINDNFFEMGGHSLLATQVISRLREAFSIDLPLRRLFDFPTVAGLAEQIENIRFYQQQLQDIASVTLNNREEIEF